MQTGGDEEATLKSSSSLSSFSSSESSFSSLSFSPASSSVISVMPRTTVDLMGERAGIGVEDCCAVGEEQCGAFAGFAGNGGLIPLPNLAAAASATSVNITQSVKVGMGETIDVEQVVHVNRRFTMPAPLAFHSQPGHFLRPSCLDHGGSDLNPLFPAASSSLLPEPLNNPYLFPCGLHSNVGFPSAAVPTLKRKQEIFGSQCNSESLPLHGESPSHQMISCYCHDSVFQSSSVAVPVLQQSIFPVSGRHSCLHYCVGEPARLEVFTNQDTSISSASQGLRISGPSGTMCPIHKRVVRQKQMSTLSLCVAPDGSKNLSFPMVIPNQIFQLHDWNAVEPVPGSSIPSSMHHSEHLNVANLSKNEKESEKGWIVILQKELRNSDVGNLGRIILPKRDCEANLPPLFERDGIILVMEDMESPFIWEFKYRYWPNNKSRMYVMESTGDFVRMHELQVGDFFIIYKEQGSGRYIVRGKKASRPSYSINQVGLNRGEQGNLEKVGSSSKQQQPKRDREMEAICPECNKEHERTSPLTGNLLVPKPRPDASPTGFPFDIDRDPGVPSQFTSSLQDFDPEMISFDRFLP